jgi:hypothetical protein
MQFDPDTERDRPFSQWPFSGRRDLAVPAGRGRTGGFIFWDMLISLVIVALVFGILIKGYVVGAERAEWTNFSLAGQDIGIQAIEKARSAVWDIAMQKNEVLTMTQAVGVVSFSYASATSTLTMVTTNLMNIPWKGTNYLLASNYITAQILYENNASSPAVQMQFVRVDTVWPFYGWGHAVKYYTNTACTYMAPDNRDPSTLGQ